MEQRIRIVLDLVVTDRRVAGHIKQAVSDPGRTTWANGEPQLLADALAGFLIEAVAPDDYASDDLYHKWNDMDWLQAAAVSVEAPPRT